MQSDFESVVWYASGIWIGALRDYCPRVSTLSAIFSNMFGEDTYTYEYFVGPRYQSEHLVHSLVNTDWVDDILDSEFDSDG